MNSPLIIDPEFESKIPPLTDDEFQQLEENILADSGVINPLIIWNGNRTSSMTKAAEHTILSAENAGTTASNHFAPQ